jgi:hypothetical protein
LILFVGCSSLTFLGRTPLANDTGEAARFCCGEWRITISSSRLLSSRSVLFDPIGPVSSIFYNILKKKIFVKTN